MEPNIRVSRTRKLITSRPLLVTIYFMGTCLIGVLDFVTGTEIGLSLFYLILVSLAAWTVGKRTGLIMAACAATGWLAVDFVTNTYSHPVIAVWNGWVRMTIFLAISLLLSHVRALTASLRDKVAEKSVALSSEIDDHKTTRSALRESEAQFRILVEGVRDCAFFLLDTEGNINSWNRGGETLTGYREEQVLYRPLTCLWPPEEIHRAGLRDALSRARREGAVEGEGWRVRSDGSRFWAACILTALHDREGQLVGFSKVIQNITYRKGIEYQVVAEEESEVQRIGWDLHDSVGQDLTALALLSKELEERLAEHGSLESPLVAKITECANRAVQQARDLARGLCPVSDEVGGLATALAELAASCSDRFDIQCEFECSENFPVEAPAFNRHLYRIAQEAITNAVKHAHASEIRGSLSTDNGLCILRIENDGELDASHPGTDGGTGVAIMKQRAKALGGYLTLERLSTGGAVVTCTVPMATWDQPARALQEQWAP